jgi:hypothetical protein
MVTIDKLYLSDLMLEINGTIYLFYYQYFIQAMVALYFTNLLVPKEF